MTRRSRGLNHPILVLLLLAVVLAGCGASKDNEQRSFAPETRGNTSLPTDTPAPTDTSEAVNVQPNEGKAGTVDAPELFAATGSAKVIDSGLNTVAVTTIADGTVHDLGIVRSASVLASAAPDGSRVLVLDRSKGPPTLQVFDVASRKKHELAIGAPATPLASPAAASPIAATTDGTPTTTSNSIQIGDRIAWNEDGSRAVVAVGGTALYAIDSKSALSRMTVPDGALVTALAWSPTAQSLGLGLWYRASQSAALATVSMQSPQAVPTEVMRLPEHDERFVRELAWGSEQAGLIFVLRSSTGNYTRPNDLYVLPKFGESMRLLASAGVASPIAVVDQIAVAQNGTTVAFSVLVPGDVGLRFQGIWVTDVLKPGSTAATTTGIRRIGELVWSPQGLVVVGTRRTLEDGRAYQATVVEHISADKPESIAVDRSVATPVGSPAASPVASPSG